MRRRAVVGVIVVALGLSSFALAAGRGGATPPQLPEVVYEHRPSCGPAPLGAARCHAIEVVAIKGGAGRKPSTTTTTSSSTSSSTASSTTTTTSPPSGGPSGYGPADLRSAYNLTGAAATLGSGATVAIVDAYDDPNAEADLAVYRATFGLPPLCHYGAAGCTGAWFRKVDQGGGSSYPQADGGWAQEISLDVDMVSAICPSCNILLVEAASASFANLGTAVDTAAGLGAVAISNSYGAKEFIFEGSYESYYNHSNVAVVASSGDSGYGVEYPAASRYVTAAGGTKLVRDGSTARGWTETAWSGAGSGCSKFISKPSWQTDSGCGARTVADVSAVSDPNTGVAVYDSFAYQGSSGWLKFGGTSVASPVVASVFALAGHASSTTSPASLPYGHRSALYDVVGGSNGSCSPAYLCTAVTGYDGPTGLGTPNGTGGF